MNVPIIAFFNNKGGMGKTSLVYHLAWMYSENNRRIVAADLDPQSNLTAAFLEEDILEQLWEGTKSSDTIYECVLPLIKGTGDIKFPRLQPIEENLALLVGDLALSGFEDQLSEVWPKCMDRDERAFRVTSSFWRIIQQAAHSFNAELVLLDLGPNLGAVNRAALIAADYVVVPLTPDLYSLQGLKNLGPTLREWRLEWSERRERQPKMDLELPEGHMNTLGYVVQQRSVRFDRPVKAYDKWVARIPSVYRTAVLNETEIEAGIDLSNDPHCLALLKQYRSLMPLAQEARKPMFSLKPADGAIGAHVQSVQGVYRDIKLLGNQILDRIGFPPMLG